MIREDRFLRKEYLRTLFPVMFSVLSGTVNTLLDSAFVSQKIGSDALAAVNMCLPAYLVICTLGALLAGGSSILSAQAAGKEDVSASRRYYHTALSLCLLLGALLTAAGIVLCRPISNLLAQGGKLSGYVYDYCLITFIGLIPTVLAYIPLYYLQLEGKGQAISIMMTLVVLVDVVLDWLFLYPLNLGIRGAAAASVISMFVACIYGMAKLEQGFSNYHFSPRELGLAGTREIIQFGSPAAVRNFCDAIRLFLMNAMILWAGGELYVAVWAVLNSLMELSICVTSGVPQAAAPMTGVFFAARENGGIRILMKLQVKAGLLLSSLFFFFLLVCHRRIAVLFALSVNLLLPLLCLGMAVIFELLCSLWGTYFNAVGRIGLSNVLMVLRTLVFPVGLSVALAVSGGYLWLFLPGGALLSLLACLILTGVLAGKSRTTDRPLSRLLLLDDSLEREGKVLDFSIRLTSEAICSASEDIRDFCAANHMDSRQTYRLQLSIEELLQVIAGRFPELESADLRAFALEDGIGIRIRSAGKRFDLFEESEQDAGDFYMGVTMLKNMAKDVNFSYTLGMNTIHILF